MLRACLYFFFTLCSYFVLRPIRDAMGVAAGVSQLPWLFTATLGVMLLANPVYSALVARYPVRRFIGITYLFFAGNLALNTTGQGYPKVSASYTSPGDRVEQATDGRIAYTKYSRNRWSARGTTSRTDWLEVDFGALRRIGRIELHFVADGAGLAAPRGVTVQYWNGHNWLPARVRRRLPDQPEGSAVNTLWIEPVEASKVRVVLEHARPATTAVTELLIWEEGP